LGVTGKGRDVSPTYREGNRDVKKKQKKKKKKSV